jgi:antagonist of KipI
MPELSIVRPGILTTVQDLGRWGFQAFGVPVSGAMDWYSHRHANRLVGNEDGDATLEATLIGPHIAFSGEAVVAVAGARFGLTLNGQPVEVNRTITAAAGSVLKFGERFSGARAYIAVAGGIDVPVVLGSRSTHVLTRMGGLEGRALRAGDRLKVGSDPLFTKSVKRGSDPVLQRGGARLRVVPGEPALFAHLGDHQFRVSAQSDRMGYRLEEMATASASGRTPSSPPGELISRAVATGTIQVPPAGGPILLMADHATTGGYAVAGTVITADLPLAGQLAPGDWIEFVPCSLDEADRALAELEAALDRA